MDIDTLRSVPLFASLDRNATAELSKLMSIQDYERSSVVFSNGDPGDVRAPQRAVDDVHRRRADELRDE